ncbi:DUF2147 domain-containing protein [Rudanella lutea]|jgi:uncharacterized protein (DUF2147 family)|uniref:DUF2147 domain-containing protein n=1 Tax=Rudanella lutea TaxID=451374 RepID=UPI00037F897D|nr:DUF2147 domain-containing protein [Rudanella lutea]
MKIQAPFFARRIVHGIAILLLLGSWSSGRNADLILGSWLFPARQSTIEVYRENGQYFGRIVEVGAAYQHKLSGNRLLFTNLTFNGKEWSGGKLIHPSSGTHYDVAIQLTNSYTLNVTVYKGLRCFQKNYQLVRK